MLMAKKLAVAAAALILLENEDKKRKRQQPRCWVNPYLRARSTKGRYVREFENMIHNPELFFDNFHMSEERFNWLLGQLEDPLTPKKNLRPDAIPIQAKLAIVLEYLASGDIHRQVGSKYRISPQHLGRTIDLVCNAICEKLAGEIPKWNQANMQKWSDEFRDVWHFPNCVGAIDGKHVAIRAPPNADNIYFNYKGFHSIVIMAVSDAKYRFTYFDVGANGSEESKTVFSRCALGKGILSNSLPFPEDSPLNGKNTPYYIVADNVFPLQKRIMKPYEHQNLTKEETVFNDRLGQARRCIDNAFGILSLRWKAVQRTMLCNPQKAQKMVTACCMLHNLLIADVEDYVPNLEDETAIDNTYTPIEPFGDNRQHQAEFIRNNLKDYVNSLDEAVVLKNESAYE